MTRHTFSTDSEAVDAYLENKDNKSAYIRQLIKADMRGPSAETAGLDVQIQTLEKQAQAHAEQEEMYQKQAEDLREVKQSIEQRNSAQLQEAKEALKDTPKEPTNPAIQKWAENTDLTAEQLCERLQHNS